MCQPGNALIQYLPRMCQPISYILLAQYSSQASLQQSSISATYSNAAQVSVA
jgi:hypothetical protein